MNGHAEEMLVGDDRRAVVGAEVVEFELDQGPRIIVRPMLTPSQATDLFLGDLTRRGYAERTVDTYKRLLDKLPDCQWIDEHDDVSKVTADDCRRFLDQWNRRSQGTRAHTFSVLSSFFQWLYKTERIKRNPLEWLDAPRRIPAEDLDVVTVSHADVRAMIDCAVGWTQRLAVAIPAYTGARRRAVSQLRLEDYDRVGMRLRFHEKGGKTIWKPVPFPLGELLELAIRDGAIVEPDDYLVPNEGTRTRAGGRDDRVIWRAVKDAAENAGVKAHVHSLRAAFAVFYLESQPGNIAALKDLLGHSSLSTTSVYLRKRDRLAGMETVRGLDWGAAPQLAGKQFASSSAVEAGGFEPPFPVDQLVERAGTQQTEKAES